MFWLEPDFTIAYGDNIITLLDTKYKSPFDNNDNVSINTSDLYQLCTYALRYNCKNLFLIYPKFLGSNREETLLAEYQIQSGFEIITLRIMQIDIMENDISKIITVLKREAYPLFLSQPSLRRDSA